MQFAWPLARLTSFDAAIASCGPGKPDGCNRARELGGMSEQRDKELARACANSASSLCRTAVQLAVASGNVVFVDQHGVPFAVPADSPMIQATPDPRDGSWHYSIAASVAEGQAIDSGGGALMGVGSAIRGLFRPSVPEIAVGAKSIEKIFEAGRTPKASELKGYAEAQGWKPFQTGGGPLKYVDENGIPRVTIKQGCPRAPGSSDPHVEFKDATGQRTDAFGNPVARKSPGNHTAIDYDF
ncbi:DUF6862 domain-containing protein [Achromobacter xylosoxidans]